MENALFDVVKYRFTPDCNLHFLPQPGNCDGLCPYQLLYAQINFEHVDTGIFWQYIATTLKVTQVGKVGFYRHKKACIFGV